MKLKGINPFEQHAEKVALGAALLLFVGLFVLQFDILGDPNAIEVPGGGSKSPDQVGSVAIERATKLGSELNGRSLADLPDERNLADAYVAALDEPVVDPSMTRLAIAGAWDESATPVELGPELYDGAAPAYARVTPPAPSRPLVRESGMTLDPLELGVYPELTAYVPQEQPYDMRLLSIETTITPAEVLAAFNATPEDSEMVRVPEKWVAQTLALLDVVYIREELVDGAWTNEVTLPAVPGQHTLRDRIVADEFDASQLADLLAEERENRGSIRRAPMYASIAGDCWLWPSLAARMQPDAATSAKRDELLDEKRRLERDIERWERQLADMAWVRPGGAWPAIPASALSQAGGGGPVPEENRGPSRDEESRKRIQERIDAARTRLGEIETELAGLGFNLEGALTLDPCSEKLNPTLEDLTSGGETPITLWTHDLTAEPGKTYRYKARIVVTNPFVGRAGSLNEEQARLAERLGLESVDSEWSAPTSMLPEVAYFVVAATDGGEQVLATPGVQAVGGGVIRPEATVEAFRFFYGYWRQAEADLRIGQAIQGEAPLPEVELPIFELQPGEEGGFRWTGNATPIAEPIPVSSPAYLVDVSSVLPTVGGRIQAAFASPGGGLELRSEDIDTASKAYQAVRESARVGQTAAIRNPGNGVRRDQGGSEAPPAPRPGVSGPREATPLPPRGDDKPGGGKPRRRY